MQPSLVGLLLPPPRSQRWHIGVTVRHSLHPRLHVAELAYGRALPASGGTLRRRGGRPSPTAWLFPVRTSPGGRTAHGEAPLLRARKRCSLHLWPMAAQAAARSWFEDVAGGARASESHLASL